MAFIKLQTKLTKLLTQADISSIRRGCIAQQRTPGGVHLSEQLKANIASTQNIGVLLDALVDSPYWSWIDIRLLQAIVAASDIPQALQLLENYKSGVFSRKLVDLLPNMPSKEVKEEFFTEIVTKLGKDANTMTVSDLLQFRLQLETVIMDIGKGACVLEHIKKGCIEVHWYIPTHCVDNAYQSASTRCYMFNEIHLLWLKITHYPVIHDPLTTPVDMTTQPPPDRAGKWYI